METENTATTQTSDAIATEINESVEKALENDPQRKLAKQVAADLEAAGVQTEDDPAAAKTEQSNSEYQEAKDRVSRVLTERNKNHKQREAARQEAELIRQEAIRMRADAEAYTRQVQHQAQQMQQFQALLRSNPAQALRHAGLDPEEFIMGIAKDGTPEGHLQRKLMEQEMKLREFEQWKQAEARKFQEAQQAHIERQQYQFRSSVETDFISKASSDKYQNVSKAIEHGLLSRNALIAEGDTIADKYREATGQEASLEEILEYIDSQVGKAISKYSGAGQGKVSTSQSRPAQVQVAKTLSNSDSSERRTLSRDLTNADSEERRAAAIDAVRAVMAKSREK